MDDLRAFWGFAGIPLVVALVTMTKTVFPDLSSRWYPLVAVLWGVAMNLALAWILIYPYNVAAFLGVVVGLAASGLYSGGKAITTKSDA